VDEIVIVIAAMVLAALLVVALVAAGLAYSQLGKANRACNASDHALKYAESRIDAALSAYDTEHTSHLNTSRRLVAALNDCEAAQQERDELRGRLERAAAEIAGAGDE
jgi:DTW domain-containing protein YfiP